jgi:hypothetical protein
VENIDKIFNRICYHCKSKIKLKRYDNENVAYYDNHYYHTQCLTDIINNEGNKLVRKCGCCKEDINLIKSENVIFYDGKYHHYECFMNKCNTMKTPKWKTALKYIDQYIEEAKQNISKLSETIKLDINELPNYELDAEKNITRIFNESDVDDFIKIQYDTTAIPWKILCKVYNGTYKNLTKPIPPEDLLDMWTQKIDSLNKIAERNRKSGNEITGIGRISYDLAILTNKYDGYLNWKEQQRIALVEQKQKRQEENNSINYENINMAVIKNNNTQNNTLNINDILDEI